ncbi:hypothetical protein N9N28_15005 [Rubripirellula amarantea]|nr:hypothetical protein [Rubripirellula amarantea]
MLNHRRFATLLTTLIQMTGLICVGLLFHDSLGSMLVLIAAIVGTVSSFIEAYFVQGLRTDDLPQEETQ